MRKRHIVDGHFWLRKSELSSADIDRIKNDLTLIGIQGRKLDPFRHFCYADAGDFLRVPRAYGLRYIDPSNIDDRRTDHPVNLEFIKSLWDYQVDPMVLVEKELRRGPTNGAVLEARAGSGKTVMSLYLASRIKQKTVVLVHTEFLVKQWQDEIRDKLGAEAGRVIKDDFEWDGYPIVIVMVQTLMARDYPPQFYDSFGLLIEDECHHAPADTFGESIGRFPARYRLGLSATLTRGDKLEQLIFWHLGRHAAKIDVGQARITVCRIKTGVTFCDEDFKFPWDKTMNRGKFITHMTRLGNRNRLIINELFSAAEKGRKIIVFSERKEHLERLSKIIDEDIASGRAPSNVKHGYYWGGMKEEDRDASTCGNILLSTYQFAKEAMNLPELDFLIMATPVRDIRQPFGRIARIHDGKKRPIAIDFRDDSPYLSRVARSRDSQFKELGYEVIDIVRS